MMISKGLIVFDNTSIQDAHASIKGEGTFTIQSKHADQPLEIDLIEPNLNSQMKIESKSNVTINQIDLYGKTNVEFTNGDENEKAVVKLVKIQQKAEIELDNVRVDGDIKAGLLSKITLTDKVILSGARIEISYSDDSNNSNPVLLGDLVSVSLSISIQNRNTNIILNEEEEDVFVIAESDKSKFDCDKWSEAFNPAAVSKYNHAYCIDKKKLVANHVTTKGKGNDKGGISGGVIAAIVIVVIVVIVVVVAVVCLVVYFVIYKKKSQSQDEDESFSSGGQNNIDSNNDI